jgi:DNA-binding PadR family transcriptional regulator
MLEELGRHGYRISPGTLYPILHRLEKKGYLRSRERRDGKSLRKIYYATSKGRKALEGPKDKIRELFHEVVERHARAKGGNSWSVPVNEQTKGSRFRARLRTLLLPV